MLLIFVIYKCSHNAAVKKYIWFMVWYSRHHKGCSSNVTKVFLLIAPLHILLYDVFQEILLTLNV